jgi:hypothetical protein
MTTTRSTLQEFRTTLPPQEVLSRAKQYFASRSPLYAAFLDMDGPGFCTFRGQGGEEIAIGVSADGDATLVTGSTYLFDMQLARFFATLPPAPNTSGT